VRGRFITTVQNNSWHPGKYLGSGIYFIQVRWHQKIWRQKVVYSK